MKHEDNDDEGKTIKPDLHEGNWEVKIAEMRLRGNSLLNTWYPLLASIMAHIGQTATLAARSAKMAKDSDKVDEHMQIARLMSALRVAVGYLHEGGAEYASRQMERVNRGELADPANQAVMGWIKTAGELPPMHLPMMDKKVLLAMRIEESEDSVRLHFDETLCGKNLHDEDDHDSQEAVRMEQEKQERKMGITNNVPAIKSADDREEDGVDEDGTTTKTTDHGAFREIRKTRARDDNGKPKKPAKPSPKDKPSLNDFLDEMLSRKQAEADKRAKEAKDKRDSEDDEPLPPSRFN